MQLQCKDDRIISETREGRRCFSTCIRVIFSGLGIPFWSRAGLILYGFLVNLIDWQDRRHTFRIISAPALPNSSIILNLSESPIPCSLIMVPSILNALFCTSLINCSPFARGLLRTKEDYVNVTCQRIHEREAKIREKHNAYRHRYVPESSQDDTCWHCGGYFDKNNVC